MEPLPRGANPRRWSLLWEIGLHLAGSSSSANDMLIGVGSGAGARFDAQLRMSTGSPQLARSVVAGDLDLAMVNPSAILTQAYRGIGAYAEPLPVRIVAVFPSWDRFVFMLHQRTGMQTLDQVREERFPLHLSVREDPCHSTRALVDQIFALHGFTIDDLEEWGGSLITCRLPRDRVQGLQDGSIDAVADEGLGQPLWFEHALRTGFIPIGFQDIIVEGLEDLGWQPKPIPAGSYDGLADECFALDYGGWPLYTRASLPDELAYGVVGAIDARSAYCLLYTSPSPR